MASQVAFDMNKAFHQVNSGQLKFSIDMFLNYIHKTTSKLGFEQLPLFPVSRF